MKFYWETLYFKHNLSNVYSMVYAGLSTQGVSVKLKLDKYNHVKYLPQYDSG